MAGSQGNGPVGTDPNTAAPRTPGSTGVNDASDPSVKAPVGDTPGTTGQNDHAAVVADKAAAATDPAIEALDLAPAAKAGAYALKAQFPDVVFTSGRRDKAGQAHAMATNVVSNRKWIEQTYLSNDVSKACQKWVDDNPKATTVDAIAAGLLGVMNSLTDAQVGELSKHFTGEAFDVQPVTTNGDAIKAAIKALPGLEKFLDKEGGKVRWHAQF